jgi:phosphoribosylaminoimidazole (AIR) synthetase
MGIGFVVVVPEAAVPQTLALATSTGHQAAQLGVVTKEPGNRVYIRPHNLVSQNGRFRRT